MPRTAIAALFALALPALALASEWDRRDRHDRGRDRDRHALHDDLRDAQLAEQLLQDFERTWAALDRNAVRAVELRVQAALEDEAREDRWEGRRDLAQDRREMADDRQDLMRAADYRERVNTLRGEWGNLRDQRVYAAMIRKHAILEELVRLSRVSIQEDMQELREDRQ